MPKATHVEVQLSSVACIRHNENDGDEIYCLCMIHHLDGRRIGSERYPNHLGHWPMLAGDQVNPEELVYVGNLDEGLLLRFSLMEMDMIRLAKNSLNIVGTWVDDCVGRVEVRIAPGQAPHFAALKSAEPLPPQHGDRRTRFRLTGNRSEYILALDVRLT